MKEGENIMDMENILNLIPTVFPAFLFGAAFAKADVYFRLKKRGITPEELREYVKALEEKKKGVR